MEMKKLTGGDARKAAMAELLWKKTTVSRVCVSPGLPLCIPEFGSIPTERSRPLVLPRSDFHVVDHVAFVGAADHGVNEALYLRVPDGNGLDPWIPGGAGERLV